MNFLAHAYLSGSDMKIITGNFIADWVKGNKKDNYPEQISRGIILHRAIDSFTDNHPVYRQSKQKLISEYHKYSGIIVDIFYDHFLASCWNKYSSFILKDFANLVYLSLVKNYFHLPPRVKFFLPNLIAVNRLGSYADIKGIQNALELMVRRTSLPEHTVYAMKILRENYVEFKSEFSDFFQEMVTYINIEHNQNTKKTHKIFPA